MRFRGSCVTFCHNDLPKQCKLHITVYCLWDLTFVFRTHLSSSIYFFVRSTTRWRTLLLVIAVPSVIIHYGVRVHRFRQCRCTCLMFTNDQHRKVVFSKIKSSNFTSTGYLDEWSPPSLLWFITKPGPLNPEVIRDQFTFRNCGSAQ